MSQITLGLTSPSGAGSALVPTVRRTFVVSGSFGISLTPGRGPVTRRSVVVQFGSGGPSVAATFSTTTNWTCTGTLPASLAPDAITSITVNGSALVRFMLAPGEPDFEDVDAQRVFAVRLLNPVPVLRIDAFAPDQQATQLPMNFTLSGTAFDPDGNLSAVQCALDTGDFAPVQMSTSDATRWSLPLQLAAGLHRFTVRALDTTGNAAQQEAFLNVHAVPEAPDQNLGSVTSWTRLEPSCRDDAMGTALSARAFDPLWLLGRQWQMGEFQGADAGTPVQARVRSTSALLSRCRMGPAPQTQPAPRYDPQRAPLEALVERRPMRPAGESDLAMQPLVVEAGLHFLRLLEAQAPGKSYRAAFVARFALAPLAGAALDAADEATRRFVQCMAGRAVDARRLAAALRAGGASALLQDPALAIAALDGAEVQQAATAWLAWYDGLFAEPAGAADEAWTAERLEYAVTVAAGLSDQPQDQVNLGAREIDDGRLDWSSFDIDRDIDLGSSGDHSFRSLTDTVVPAPVSFRGAPAVRFWELEDERLAYGLLPVGPTDLAHLMLIEYAGSYGNDWFLLPLTLPVGSVTRVDSLVVTDSFGVRTLLNPIGSQGTIAAGFSMWQHAQLKRPGSFAPDSIRPNLFFLPPALGQTLEGAALEEVALLRDEMANVAWAIEKSTESPAEVATVYNARPAAALTAPPPSASAAPLYRVASTVPGNWIPLLPVQLRSLQGQLLSRLKRGALLQPDGSSVPPHAQSQLLNAGGSLLLHDEDIPREGLQMSKGRRMSRWIDGSTWVWTAFRKRVGHGEGSSGPAFDRLLHQERDASQ